jgi:hypothetical protein
MGGCRDEKDEKLPEEILNIRKCFEDFQKIKKKPIDPGETM